MSENGILEIRQESIKKRKVYRSPEQIQTILEEWRRAKDIKGICEREKIHPAMIYKWNKAWESEGLEGLQRRLKRQVKCKDPEKERLIRRLHQVEEAVISQAIENALLKKNLEEGFR